jgi:tungstate transport system substrate-binding protein
MSRETIRGDRLRRYSRVFAVTLLIVAALIPVSPVAAERTGNVLMMATTTSTDNTGLLDYLAPELKKDTGIELRWTAVGTGKALELGKNCDVDVLLVHAPEAETRFVEEGFGVGRREIMYNDFVLIGPGPDPAGLKGKGVKDAMSLIRSRQAVFVSRGDESGTHKKEQALWRSAGLPVPEKEAWYMQAGQGMLVSINMAAERGGYTLTDRGTYIKYEDNHKGNPPLKIVVEKDPGLQNQYSVMAVNPKNCPKAQYELAMKFSDWIAGQRGQQVIKEFKILGKQLFVPNAK